MIKKPNRIQKLLHLLGWLRPVTSFFSTRWYRIDETLLNWTGNKISLSRLVGWPVASITTRGAKTGLPRNILLNAFPDGNKIVLIGSNFGSEYNPGWYHNLKKNPECFVELKGWSGKYNARETDGAEREECWQMALSYYSAYEKYQEWASPRKIPTIVLEPVE